MSGKIAVVFHLLAIVAIGNCLLCNLCIGSSNSDCARNVSRSMATQTCFAPRPHPHIHYNGKPKISTMDVVNFDGTLTNDVDNSIDNNFGPTPNVDLHCVYLSIRGDRLSSDRVERGCGYIYHNQDFCDFMKKRKRNIEDCSTCDTDQCN